MKLKLDENMPAQLVAALGDLGHDVDTVAHIRHYWAPSTSKYCAFLSLADEDFRRDPVS